MRKPCIEDCYCPYLFYKMFFMTLPSHINVRKSARARRLALRLDPKARVFDLVVPKGVSMRKAERFAESHEGWMRDKLAELPSAIAFVDGAIIPVMGRDRVIDVFVDDSIKRTKITMTDTHLEVRTNLDDPQSRIRRWLKALAKEELEAMSHVKAAEIGKNVAAVSIRDTKSRWGSCSESGKISYSWRLIFAPWAAIDYVVAHEVAHLQHMDHSKAFWSVCEGLSEDYKAGHGWMKRHGSEELMRFG
jgi:predicted metal-dependent hydrolase